LTDLLPDEPEVLGLAALVCLSEARRPARQAGDGGFIALDDQNTRLWDRALIDRGEALLRRAHASGLPGRYQVEAAIQSAHCDRARSGATDWHALRTLHRALIRIAPSLGASVSLAAVEAEVDGPHAGLAVLEALEDDAECTIFQPFWSTRAHLLAQSGQRSAAADAYARAIELTEDGGLLRHLVALRAKLRE
jgi:RNA polymerase sigma-70 factor (ECF subfamily)